MKRRRLRIKKEIPYVFVMTGNGMLQNCGRQMAGYAVSNIMRMSACGKSIFYTYDGNGSRTGITDMEGNRMIFTYDALGNETRYAYDTMGHLVKVERTGETSEIQTTAYQWDTRGLVTSIKNPMGAER